MGHSPLDDLFESHETHSRHGKRRQPRRGSFIRKALPAFLVLVVLVAVVAGGYWGYSWISSNINVASEPDDFEGDGGESVVITVNEGDTGTDIAKSLVEAGVIKSTGPFVTAFAAHPDAAGIKPGAYTLRKQMKSSAALELLLSPTSFAGIRVTFPEGQRASVMYKRVSEATGIPVEEFENAAKDYTSLGVPENPAKSVEGYLWPGTYDFTKDQSAKDILTQMVERMEKKLAEKGIPEDKWHEYLTLASIAEKEARSEGDYGRVVRTLENRMQGVGEAKGRPMKLQLDSTVAYVHNLETVDTTADQRSVDSPYNTYKYEGLPIGPISNPGDKTLDAAVNPPEGPWLYWVTVNTETGETKFAETLDEHNKNVEEWRQWARNR